jgi:hypothetical protein
MSKAEKQVVSEQKMGDAAQVVVAPAAKKTFKVTRVISRTVRKLESGKPVYLLIESKIELGKQMPAKLNPDTGEMELPKPAMTCDVTDLESDTKHVLLANSVLHKELEENYPNSAYVGKSFQIINNGKLPGKRYHTFTINEVEAS